jgi:hypothetical protein
MFESLFASKATVLVMLAGYYRSADIYEPTVSTGGCICCLMARKGEPDMS